MSGAAQEPDGYAHSINDLGFPVEMRIILEAEWQQFKDLLVDLSNHLEKTIKVVNADDSLMVMYLLQLPLAAIKSRAQRTILPPLGAASGYPFPSFFT